MISIDKCPVCDGKYIAKNTHGAYGPHGSTMDVIGESLPTMLVTKYSTCQSCGLIFQSPRFTDEQLERFYGDGTYRAMIGMSQEEQDKDELYRATYDAGLLKSFGIEPKSHLDIGSSRGFFLEQVGADVQYGVEPNEGYKSRDVGHIEEQRKVDKVSKNDFELVSMLHVLEHVPDPMFYIWMAACRVSAEGTIMIEVPSDRSPGGWARLPHLYHFQPWTLTHMLTELGLRITHLMYTPHLLVLCRIVED